MIFKEWWETSGKFIGGAVGADCSDASASWDAATKEAKKKYDLTFQALENIIMYREGTPHYEWAVEHYQKMKAEQEKVNDV